MEEALRNESDYMGQVSFYCYRLAALKSVTRGLLVKPVTFDLTALTLAQFQLFLLVCLVLYVKGLNGCLNPRYITNNL